MFKFDHNVKQIMNVEIVWKYEIMMMMLCRCICDRWNKLNESLNENDMERIRIENSK